MKYASLFLAPLALAACATTPAPAPAPEGSQVALGRAVQVGKLVATPAKVVEDSRCPINARCVWAGRAVVKTRIDGDGWSETLDLTLGEIHALHATSITLVSVEPGKLAGQKTDPKAYRFAFEGGN